MNFSVSVFICNFVGNVQISRGERNVESDMSPKKFLFGQSFVVRWLQYHQNYKRGLGRFITAYVLLRSGRMEKK
jgi:hypothetical protein